MNKPLIIGLAGPAGVGKTTLATELHRAWGERRVLYGRPKPTCIRLAFATPVRRAAAAAAGEPEERWIGIGARTKAELLPELGITRGRLLQIVGQALRRDAHPDIWVQALARTMDGALRHVEDTALVIIDDVRLPNEAEWILSRRGTVLALSRPGYVRPDDGRDPNCVTEQGLPPDLVMGRLVLPPMAEMGALAERLLKQAKEARGG